VSLKRRIIPVVLLRGGHAVQSKGFRRYQQLGNPMTIVERLSAWASDELVYLDITRGGQTRDAGRDDLAGSSPAELSAILREVARRCRMPLTLGGGIRSLEDAAQRIGVGGDKILINTVALRDPGFVNRASREFGAQCVVVGVDARRRPEGGWTVVVPGSEHVDREPVAWARELVDRGAGEILIQSIDEDGRGRGYDLPLVAAVSEAVRVPVIALGGAGTGEHLAEGLRAGADAVAAANMFNYVEHAVLRAREQVFDEGLDVRAPELADVGVAGG